MRHMLDLPARAAAMRTALNELTRRCLGGYEPNATNSTENIALSLKFYEFLGNVVLLDLERSLRFTD